MKQTTNYSIFKYKPGNRAVNQKHVKKLKESFQKHDFLPSCPIIVDKNMYVIDGQHRLEAAKQLGIAVYYTVETEPDADLLIDLNITQRKWYAIDYVRYFADKNSHYKRFLQLLTEVPLDVVSVLNMATGKDLGGAFINEVVKTGQLEVTAEQIQRAHITYDNLLALRDALRCKITGRTIKAIIYLQNNPKFSWGTMLQKANKYYAKSYPCSTKQEWVDMLIKLYNCNTQQCHRIKE